MITYFNEDCPHCGEADGVDVVADDDGISRLCSCGYEAANESLAMIAGNAKPEGEGK